MAPGTSAMLRARRRDVNVKPNRRLDRSSTRGMIYENEELRLRTININAEVERSQDDIKKLRRENDQLRRELWGLRDEYDKLEALLKRKQVGDASDEFSEDEEEGEVEEEEEEDGEQSGEEEEEEEEEEDNDGAGGDRTGERVEADPAQDDATKSAATSRDRQVDFDMLSVVQEETENDQTDSQTGGEDQGASPIIPRKKGVCFLLEPLPEHQPAPAEQPQQPAQPAPQPTPQPAQPGVQLVCDQYLVSAEGKPLRGAAGQFLTTADLARDPFQYPAAYGYATGTIVGGVLIPAVDPSTGIPLTGLYQEDAYGTEVPVGHGLNGGHVNGSALGFDGLVPELSWAAASSSSSPAQTEDDPQMPVMQPRGAPDLFVDGAYPVGQSADGSPSSGVIEQLLRNINLGVVDDPAGTGEKPWEQPGFPWRRRLPAGDLHDQGIGVASGPPPGGGYGCNGPGAPLDGRGARARPGGGYQGSTPRIVVRRPSEPQVEAPAGGAPGPQPGLQPGLGTGADPGAAPHRRYSYSSTLYHWPAPPQAVLPLAQAGDSRAASPAEQQLDVGATVTASATAPTLLERRRKSYHERELHSLQLYLPPPGDETPPPTSPSSSSPTAAVTTPDGAVLLEQHPRHRYAPGDRPGRTPYHTLPVAVRDKGDGPLAASMYRAAEVRAPCCLVAEDGTDCRVGGVFVALRGVPVGVPDSDVSAALSQLGVVVGGIHRLGGPGPQDGGAAGDGDPGGGGEVQERVAHLVPWPQLPHQSTVPPLPTHLGVAGTLAELRQLSEHEASLLDLEDSGDMRDKSLRDSSAVNDKPFRSQIQVRLRHPQAPPGPGGGSLRGPRLVAAASPPTGRREAATNSLPLRGRQLCAQGAAAPGLAPVPLQGPRPRLLGPALQPHVIPGYHTGTLRRPSTPFPVGMLRAPGVPMGPLAPLNAGPRAAPATHALSGADLPVVTMPMPLAVVTNGRPVPVSAGALAESCGDATPASSLAAPVPSLVVATSAPSEAVGPPPPSAAVPSTPLPTPGAGPKHGGIQAQDSLGSASSVCVDPSERGAVEPGPRTERSQTMESRLEAPSSLRSLPASPAASPAPSRRAPHGKRLLRKQSSAQSLEEPVTNGNALAPSPSSRRRMAKQKAHAQGEPSTPGAVSSSGSTATPGTPSKHPGQAGRPHAADVSQSSSSGQESPNKSERRRRVSILSRKPRRAPSPTDAILPADHTTTASERERTNSASSRDSRVSAWRATGRRRLSSIRRDNSTERESGKVPWCGCWGNGCL